MAYESSKKVGETLMAYESAKKIGNDDDDDANKKIAMARRAVRSLAISLVANLTLPATIMFVSRTGQKYVALSKPIWFPPVPVIHLATLGSSFSMGLAGWLVWADGGFQANKGNALHIYVSQISSSVMWHPLVLSLGSPKFGWLFCVANLGLLIACYQIFRKVNPIAGVLVKPPLAWAAFLSFLTCYLI